MAKITSVHAHEIIDSRGAPTIEAIMTLDNNSIITTAVPSGTSVGKHEAVELRDGDKTRFAGMGVKKAVSYINELIGPKLIGANPEKQQEIDYWLIKADGTKDKSNLGANTTLAVSQMILKGGAASTSMPLFKYVNSLYTKMFQSTIKIERIPSPIFNIINGGKHANDTLEFQEFQVVPSSSYSFTKAYETGVELYHELKHVLRYRNANIAVGEEGGFTPNFSVNADALEVINETITQKNLKIGLDVFLGLDMAASHFQKDDRYLIKDKPHPMKKEEYLEFVKKMLGNYSILILEDPLNEDDWDSWKKFTADVPDQVYIVGDDLLTTNKERLLHAIKDHSCTTILIKPNQIGTITETLEVIDIARKNNFTYIVSHRSGETNDSLIADFAVGVQSDFVKFGAPSRGERVAKYNRLWQIERDELKLTA